MYADKYFHKYCDKFGNEYQVTLSELDYAGSATEVDCGPVPFTIDLETQSELKTGQVRPSKGTAVFLSEAGFDLEELFTGQEDTYQLTLTKNSSLVWRGNVVPDGFSQDNYDANIRRLTVSATDNLATLKGKQFTDANGDNYALSVGNYQSFLWVIKEALKKTGLNLPIWSLVDLKALVNKETTLVEQTMVFAGAARMVVTSDIITIARSNELEALLVPGRVVRVIGGVHDGMEFTVQSTETNPASTTTRILFITFEESIPTGITFDEFEVKDEKTPASVVLSRRGHFNDFAPSEVGIFKEGVNFDFLKVGDIVRISGSTNGNNGEYTVTGWAHSVPPDAPYIRIQLSPAVPTQVHENVVISITSVSTEFPDPLSETHHDINIWVRDGKVEGKTYFEARGGAMTSWEVLDAIARQWGVVIQQNLGRWEVKRWNVDKQPAADLEWFVYNSDGLPSGRVPFQADKAFPCVPTEAAHRQYGATLRMDRVLSRAIVNYKFKYKKDGDSLRNFIVNGNFEGAFNPTPRGWNRVDLLTHLNPKLQFLPETLDVPPGFKTAIRVKNSVNTQWIDNMTDASLAEVKKGDELVISWWEKIEDGTGTSRGVYLFELFPTKEVALRASTRARASGGRGRSEVEPELAQYCLRFSGAEAIRGNVQLDYEFKGTWTEIRTQGEYENLRFQTTLRADDIGEWHKITVIAEKVPVDGWLKFGIVGAASGDWRGGDAARQVPVYKTEWSNSGRPGQTNVIGPPSGGASSSTVSKGYLALSPPYDQETLMVTGVFIARILDTGHDAVPQIDPFMYPDFQTQLGRKFSDTSPELEVLTGDDFGVFSEDRISGMTMDGRPTTMWDTWDSRFGWSRQGLITAKSLMEMYWKPTRLLDCTLTANGLDWSSRITFEDIPGKRFVILRGSLSGPHGKFTGTLTEIYDENETPLPPGGSDGDNTTEPNWQSTGVTRCVKSETTGLNTGEVEIVERDINAASPTFGQERWVISGTDTAMCPIGGTYDIMWGEQLTLNVAALQRTPYFKDGDRYEVGFYNDGGDRYLRFLHRVDLGTIRSIIYPGGYVNNTGWVYEPDVVMGGETYKHIRLSWFVGVISNFRITFVIN